MVAPHLIFGAAVGWPQVEAIVVWHVRGVRVQAESQTDEAASRTALSVLLWLTCHLHFNRAVLKFGSVQDHQLKSIGYVDRCRVDDSQRLAALVCDQFSFHVLWMLIAQLVEAD